MVPVYTIACTLSIQYYRQHVYIASIYEFYESLVIAAFFLLLCQYLQHDATSLSQAFAIVEPKPWIYPIRFFVVHIGRNKAGKAQDGIRLLNTIWVGVFQFCFVKFAGALIKCITEAADVYCKESNSARHAKIWIMVIEIISLVTAMMCLLQFYHQTREQIKQHNALLKFAAIKIVIFVFYVQSGPQFIFGMLTKEGGAIKPTAYISHPSWAVGIPNTLLCFEMAAVSVMHLWAYPCAPYVMRQDQQSDVPLADGLEDSHMTYDSGSQDPFASSNSAELAATKSYVGGAYGIGRAMFDMFNFLDIVRAVAQGSRWLFVQRRRVIR
ncbi:duf300 domain-containing protein [Colletotrichum sojae]|uniref:Duf300 domain-containing protein n=1 Tax=Colletotrichum sojae TaxID=2175907 RepID=A0A8H6MT91_9PEZI|nr:duf300 domain-containing protein [Colletotrichum sojae]